MRHKPRHHSSRRQPRNGLWFDLGRIFFPDLIHHPRAMRAKMLIMTLGLAALFVGALIGFYRKANTPAELLQIQARELNR
jgi:hypothetical protein